MVKEELIEILSEYVDEDNIFLQGTIAEEEDYPETFATFFITEAPFDRFYDNTHNATNWHISVMLYSSDPQVLIDTPPLMISALKSGGFIPGGAGIDIISDVKTHTGWAMDFIYQEPAE